MDNKDPLETLNSEIVNRQTYHENTTLTATVKEQSELIKELEESLIICKKWFFECDDKPSKEQVEQILKDK